MRRAAGGGRLSTALLAACVFAACAGSGGFWVDDVGALRVSEITQEGDAARRASSRLVVEGLEADAAGLSEGALGSYERALQVDPTNPYAYLAIARHETDGTAPEHALPYLDRARALFDMQGEKSPRVEVHLIGLRGDVFYSTGNVEEGVLYLERARRLAPTVWSDGRLSADELL